MWEKEQDEKCHGMSDGFDIESMAKGFGKEFKIALLKKKEKMLEAKLEFIREINRLISASNAEPAEPKEKKDVK